MTATRDDPSAVESLIATLMLAIFWSAFGCLAGGLVLWIRDHASPPGALLLTGGLLGLMLLPILRLAAAIAASYRRRDWLTFGSTLAVLAILFALTLRQAASLR